MSSCSSVPVHPGGPSPCSPPPLGRHRLLRHFEPTSTPCSRPAGNAMISTEQCNHRAITNQISERPIPTLSVPPGSVRTAGAPSSCSTTWSWSGSSIIGGPTRIPVHARSETNWFRVAPGDGTRLHSTVVPPAAEPRRQCSRRLLLKTPSEQLEPASTNAQSSDEPCPAESTSGSRLRRVRVVAATGLEFGIDARTGLLGTLVEFGGVRRRQRTCQTESPALLDEQVAIQGVVRADCLRWNAHVHQQREVGNCESVTWHLDDIWLRNGTRLVVLTHERIVPHPNSRRKVLGITSRVGRFRCRRVGSGASRVGRG